MIRKLTLAVGFGAGYVLGAKAGKERYAQIESKVRELLGQPAVQDFTSNVSSTASAAADRAKTTVNEKVESVGDKVSSSSSGTPSYGTSGTSVANADDIVVDLGSTGAATTGPIVGAAPSGTAPDLR